jgi:hypothetical protein
MSARALMIAMAGLLGACGTLGSGPSEPEGLPHGGVGPFRLLSADEIGVPPPPAGATLLERERAIESGMVAGGHLFYAAAPPRRPAPPTDGGKPDAGSPDAGTPDAGRAPPDVDWSQYEPRRIYRSPPRGGGELGFDAGSEILAAVEPWEGGLVRDPWAVLLPDGRARLYYAAEGGIGVAEAPSIDGAFTRIGDGRAIDAPGARRPSVISGIEVGQRAFLLYLEREGRIEIHGSDDGVSFERLVPAVELPPLAPRDETDSTEVAIGAPGVLWAHTEAGRTIVRMYYESRRADGQILIALAGSFDGLRFEPYPVPVMETRDLRLPAPRQLDSRITLLYLVSPRYRSPERGALVVAIAPGGITLP